MKLKVWYGKEWDPQIEQTYAMVKEIEVKTLEEGFIKMQGENWSPNSEARDHIISLGLKHTSMSIGDAFQDENGVYFVVESFGFRKCDSLPTITRRL